MTAQGILELGILFMFDVLIDWLEEYRSFLFVKEDVLRKSLIDASELRSVLASQMACVGRLILQTINRCNDLQLSEGLYL